LIRIGDISEWLKQELSGFEINQDFTDEGYFERLNNPESEVNILLGSRSFYEGWDSNRPNVIMYINIGTGVDARKFILQSVGRGVRIEPLKDQRKRLRELHASGALDEASHLLFDTINKDILPLESVFIFGTNREALNLVISELDQQAKQAGEQEISLEINQEAVQGKLLLLPVYTESALPLYQRRNLAKFQLSAENLALLRRYVEYVTDDRVLLALHDGFQPEHVAALRASLLNAQASTLTGGRNYRNLDVLARQALSYFAIHGKEFSRFKELEDEIVHFRHVKVNLEALGDLERRIRLVLESATAVREAVARFQAGEISAEDFTEQMGRHRQAESYHANNYQLDIRRIAHHYYIPVLLSPDEKIDFIRSVIHVQSEVQFLNHLEDHLSSRDNQFKQLDWWLFSRLDEKLDNIAIPYYYPIENRIASFKPDFIFWLKKGDRYYILFIDPKGTGRTEYEHKVDGYRALFEADGQAKVFSYQGLQVSVHVFLFTPDVQYLAEGYRRYWFDRIEQVIESILHGQRPIKP
jgi:hypothetical protein